MAHLRLSSSDGPAEVIPLRDERLLVGRSRDCGLVLPDVLLSRRHAEIAPDPGRLGRPGPRQHERNPAERGAHRGRAPPRGRRRRAGGRVAPGLLRDRGRVRPREHSRPPGPGPRHHLAGHEVRHRARRPRPPGTTARGPHSCRQRAGGDQHRGPASGHPAGPPHGGRPRAAGSGGAPRKRPHHPRDRGHAPRRAERHHDDRPRGRGAGPGRAHRAPRTPRPLRGRQRPLGAVRSPVVHRPGGGRQTGWWASWPSRPRPSPPPSAKITSAS